MFDENDLLGGGSEFAFGSGDDCRDSVLSIASISFASMSKDFGRDFAEALFFLIFVDLGGGSEILIGSNDDGGDSAFSIACSCFPSMSEIFGRDFARALFFLIFDDFGKFRSFVSSGHDSLEIIGARIGFGFLVVSSGVSSVGRPANLGLLRGFRDPELGVAAQIGDDASNRMHEPGLGEDEPEMAREPGEETGEQGGALGTGEEAFARGDVSGL